MDTFFVYLASLVGCLLLLVDIVFGSCMNVVDDYDVVIVGGGMSGISAAAQLIAESDLSVVVLDRPNVLAGASNRRRTLERVDQMARLMDGQSKRARIGSFRMKATKSLHSCKNMT